MNFGSLWQRSDFQALTQGATSVLADDVEKTASVNHENP